jgi:CRP/FNR family transcriptional regulator, cyclic AMP receptor protein
MATPELQAKRAILNLQRHFDKGQFLFKEGDVNSDLYILAAGSVEVIRNGKSVATISDRGSFIGEMSTLLKVPRTAALRAQTDVACLVVPSESVDKFFAESPSVALRLCQILAKRLQSTTGEFTQLKHEAAALEEGYLKLYEDIIKQFQLRKGDDLKQILADHRKMTPCIRERYLV